MGKNGTDMYGDDHFSIETRGDMGYPHFRNPNVMTISYYIPPGLVLQNYGKTVLNLVFPCYLMARKRGIAHFQTPQEHLFKHRWTIKVHHVPQPFKKVILQDISTSTS
jgi:hypothetical protein